MYPDPFATGLPAVTAVQANDVVLLRRNGVNYQIKASDLIAGLKLLG